MVGYKFRLNSTDGYSLSAATTGTGTAFPFNDCRQVNWEIVSDGTTSGGTVKIESASASDYSGTWNELDSLDASTISGGASYGNTTPMPPGGWVRARVSSNITGGGSITVKLNGLLQ